MSLFDLRLVDPKAPGEYSVYLDGWSGLSATSDRKAPGVLQFSYPADGEGRELLEWYGLVAFLQDGVEAENCRYLIRGLAGDDAPPGEQTDTGTLSYALKTVWDALREIEVPNPGTSKVITYENDPVGQLLYDAVDTAAGKGWLDWWGYDGMTFTATTDSNGRAWPVIESVQFDDGTTVFELADWLIDNHYLEVSTSGGRLNAWIPDSRGLDLTKTAKPVLLAEGGNLQDAPWEQSWDDVASSVTVVGGETTSTGNDGVTMPRLKVTVVGTGAPTVATTINLPVACGNFYGGYTRHDKNRIYQGKDWEARIPAQIQLVIQSGAWLFGAIELHEETADDLPAGGHHYFLSRLQAVDPDWDLFEGKGGNHLLYRPSRVSPVTWANLPDPGGRWMSDFVMSENVTGYQFHILLGHFRADDLPVKPKAGQKQQPGKSRAAERKKEAQFVAHRASVTKLPLIFMADINSATASKGEPRDIIEGAGLVPMRKRGTTGFADWNSHSAAHKGWWIEDVWTRKTQTVSGMTGIPTNGASDHYLWLKLTVTIRANVPEETGAYGVRQKRITVDGVQSIATAGRGREGDPDPGAGEPEHPVHRARLLHPLLLHRADRERAAHVHPVERQHAGGDDDRDRDRDRDG
jgi:hypothetical protein